MPASPLSAYVKLRGERLEFYLFSDQLPPLLVVRGERGKALFGILSEVYGCTCENGVKMLALKPLQAPAALTWLVASLSTGPSRELLEALMRSTPASALQLILELVDAGGAYGRDGPLIPGRKLRRASKIVVSILRLHGVLT